MTAPPATSLGEEAGNSSVVAAASAEHLAGKWSLHLEGEMKKTERWWEAAASLIAGEGIPTTAMGSKITGVYWFGVIIIIILFFCGVCLLGRLS
jgi:hypothetical protein